jgi:hypothetical protein
MVGHPPRVLGLEAMTTTLGVPPIVTLAASSVQPAGTRATPM